MFNSALIPNVMGVHNVYHAVLQANSKQMRGSLVWSSQINVVALKHNAGQKFFKQYCNFFFQTAF